MAGGDDRRAVPAIGCHGSLLAERQRLYRPRRERDRTAAPGGRELRHGQRRRRARPGDRFPVHPRTRRDVRRRHRAARAHDGRPCVPAPGEQGRARGGRAAAPGPERARRPALRRDRSDALPAHALLPVPVVLRRGPGPHRVLRRGHDGLLPGAGRAPAPDRRPCRADALHQSHGARLRGPGRRHDRVHRWQRGGLRRRHPRHRRRKLRTAPEERPRSTRPLETLPSRGLQSPAAGRRHRRFPQRAGRRRTLLPVRDRRTTARVLGGGRRPVRADPPGPAARAPPVPAPQRERGQARDGLPQTPSPPPAPSPSGCGRTRSRGSTPTSRR